MYKIVLFVPFQQFFDYIQKVSIWLLWHIILAKFWFWSIQKSHHKIIIAIYVRATTYNNFSEFFITLFLDFCASSEYMPKRRFSALATWCKWNIRTCTPWGTSYNGNEFIIMLNVSNQQLANFSQLNGSRQVILFFVNKLTVFL